MRTQAERFWSKVHVDGPTQPHMATPCWVWTGAKFQSGYGQFRLHGKRGPMRIASRVAWALVNGAVPDGLCVLHRCDNPLCVRAEADPGTSHLFLGTQAENTADKVAKSRQARGENSGHAKLTEAQVREIRQRAASGEGRIDIAARLGVSLSLVAMILAGQRWGWLPDAPRPIANQTG